MENEPSKLAGEDAEAQRLQLQPAVAQELDAIIGGLLRAAVLEGKGRLPVEQVRGAYANLGSAGKLAARGIRTTYTTTSPPTAA